jgi:riboflavin synthase
MFTGIIAEAGTVQNVRVTTKGIRLSVAASTCARGLKRGDSLAVNGCCLTVVGLAGRGRARIISFDLLRESWERTNFAALRPGSLVNLERPLRADGRLDGHFVTGHVDGTAAVTRWERTGADWVLELSLPTALRRYVVPKGSLAVDGISLTVAALTRTGCRLFIIPHTCAVTNLRERRAGDRVNVEADILGKYVERFARARRAG